MSDYISKSELKEKLVYCKGLGRTSLEAVIKTIETMPVVDEKEIIRKPMERIVERLEEQKQQYKRRRIENAEKNIRHMMEMNYAKECSYDYAIKIVKEEGGIE